METEGTEEFETQQHLLRQWEVVEKEMLEVGQCFDCIRHVTVAEL